MSDLYTFSLTDTQIKKFKEWKKQFDHLQTGPIGGIFSFQFKPTTIGLTLVKVIMEIGFDEFNNKQISTFDLTDYGDF